MTWYKGARLIFVILIPSSSITMNKFLVSITFCLFVLTSCETDQQVVEGNRHEAIHTLMHYSHENGIFNGSIVVAENGEVLYQDALGVSDEVTGDELTVDSQFYLASVSKQFTTMAVMILMEKDMLTYNDRLLDYFPEFPAYADAVPVRHLMTHTSGIPDHFRLGAYKPGRYSLEPGHRFADQRLRTPHEPQQSEADLRKNSACSIAPWSTHEKCHRLGLQTRRVDHVRPAGHR